MRSNVVDIEVIYHHDTHLAVLVSADEDEASEMIWLPKSQIEYDTLPAISGTIVEITMTRRLAEEKGLI